MLYVFRGNCKYYLNDHEEVFKGNLTGLSEPRSADALG